MGSIHGGHGWRAVVVQDGDGRWLKVASWLLESQPDPSAAALASLAYAYSLNADKFGSAVTVRVLKCMRPGPFYSNLSNDQYLQLSGVNADGTVGATQSNADPTGTPYVPGENYGISQS